jgi:hypothetical protein
MPSPREVDRMRKASGSVETTDRVVSFLYLLARDVLAVGEIERCVDLVADRDAGAPVLWKLTNGWLAAWATDAAERLRPPTVVVRETGPISREDVDDFHGGVVPPGRTVVEPSGA